MATSAAGIQDKKSAPDLAKIAGMTSRVVQVTKHLSKTGAGQLVVPAWKGVTADQITGLQTSLPNQHGPGTYNFEVYDEGGPEKDAWTVRLGPDIPEMPAPPPPWASVLPHFGDTNGSAPAGSRDLGGGYRYDEATGLLITPDKRAIAWRPGEPLPGSDSPRAGAGATPWWSNQWAAPTGQAPPWASFGWGSIPVDKGNDDDAKTRLLEERLRESEARHAEAERRREMSEMRAAFEKTIETTNQRFEALVSKLTEQKPVGPNPEVESLKQTVEMLRQQNEQQRRDSEAAQREDRMRAEMRQVQESTAAAIREMSSNKADPTLAMLTQVMTAAQQQQAEVVRAIRDTSAAQAQASERNSNLVAERLSSSIMTPLQIVDLMKMAKDQSANSEINKSMVEMFQNLFGMAQGLVREQAEMYSQQGGPAWLPIAQEGVQQIGRVAQMFAQQKAGAENQAALVERRARMIALQQQQQMQQQMLAQRQAAAQRPAPPPRTHAEAVRDAAANHVFGQPTAVESERDAAAAHVFGNRKVQPPSAASAAPVPAAAAAAKRPRRRRQADAAAPVPTAPPAAASAAPLVAGAIIQPDGSIVPAATTHEVPMVAPPSPAPIIRRARPANQPPPPPPELLDDEAGDVDEEDVEGDEDDGDEDDGGTGGVGAAALSAEMANAAPQDLRVITDQMDDTEFFGPALSDVSELRNRLATQPENLTPLDVAKWILAARQQLMSFGIFPPAAEMLDHGHVEILVERLVPGAPPMAIGAIVLKTRELMAQVGIGQPR